MEGSSCSDGFSFPPPLPGWEEVDSKTPSVTGALFVCWPISGQTPVEREWKGLGLNGGRWVALGFGGEGVCDLDGGWLEAGLRFCPSLGQRTVVKVSPAVSCFLFVCFWQLRTEDSAMEVKGRWVCIVSVMRR